MEAGFTVNASKRSFYRTEISFLGHVITEKWVALCPKRIEAILICPPPKNQKQLRQFLGVYNYHHRFKTGYANLIAPLLALLKKRNEMEVDSRVALGFGNFES